MKKFLSGYKKMLIFPAMLIAALSAVQVAALPPVDGTGVPPFVGVYGGRYRSGAFVSQGKQPRDLVCDGFIGTAAVTIAAGDVLILVTGTAYPFQVSKTATAGDVRVVGVALDGSSIGVTVPVCTDGFARVTVAQGMTANAKLIAGATAGIATNVTQVAEDSYTALSQSAIIGRAFESNPLTSTTSVIAKIKIIN